MQANVLSACANVGYYRADCRIDWVRRSRRCRSQLLCTERASKIRNLMRRLRRRCRPRTKDTDRRASHRRLQVPPATWPILPAWPTRRFQSASQISCTELVAHIVPDHSSWERRGGVFMRQNRVNRMASGDVQGFCIQNWYIPENVLEFSVS